MFAIWLASGDKYIKEAQTSAKSVKEKMPDVTTYLFSLRDRDGFDKTVTMKQVDAPWYTQLIGWCRESLELLPDDARILYLDTDIYMVEPVYDLFDMLDKYDICGVHAPIRFTQPLTAMPIEIPAAFPELNIGMLAFRNNAVIKNLFADWHRKHGTNAYGNNDQRSLRAALWESEAKLYILTPEYNFRFGFGGFVGRRIKILHGRPKDKDWKGLVEQISVPGVMRTWKRGELG